VANTVPDPACTHPKFAHHVAVNRINQDGSPDSPATAFMADVHIWCADPPHGCGRPFQFIGLPLGMSYAQPMASPDGTELRAPITPMPA
jgi:hypothetical protein